MTFADAALSICDENVVAIATIIRARRLEQPDVDWLELVAARARSWSPFLARGLAIESWVAMLREASV